MSSELINANKIKTIQNIKNKINETIQEELQKKELLLNFKKVTFDMCYKKNVLRDIIKVFVLLLTIEIKLKKLRTKK